MKIIIKKTLTTKYAIIFLRKKLNLNHFLQEDATEREEKTEELSEDSKNEEQNKKEKDAVDLLEDWLSSEEVA